MKKILVALFLTLLAVSPAFATFEQSMAAGNEALQRGDFAVAVGHFRQAINRQSRSFEAQYNLAFALLGQGRFQDSVNEFRKALGLNPNSADAWANIAVAFQNMDRAGDALDALTRAASMDPTNVTVRINLASTYANTGRLNQALAEYEKLIKDGYTQPMVLINYAKCLITAGRHDQARELLQKAVQAEPDNPEARRELAFLYWNQDKDRAKAIAEFRSAISANPSLVQLYQDLASALEEDEQAQEAATVLRRALVHTNESIVRQRIQTWIDRLEGRSIGSAPAPRPEMGGMQTLQRENAPRTTTAAPAAPGRRIEVNFDGLMDDGESGGGSDPFGDIQGGR
jgi:tetratricopeptide (TPR) repeat protein